MSTFEKIPPDDPRLTAFALGEMEPAERAEFEKLLKHDAAARDLVAEITGTAQSIGVALAHEPVPTLPPVRLGQAAIIAGRDRRKLDGGPLPADDVPHGLAKLLRFPQLYFTISGLAAACFALGFVFWQASRVPTRQVHYTEVDLTKFAPAAANTKEATASEALLEVGLQPASVGSDDGVAGGAKEGKDNSFLAAASEPVSTFPIKAATAAYENVQHFIKGGQRPPVAAARIEELVNYFPYHYAPPEAAPVEREALPFAAHLEVATAPWAPEHRLVRIGLKGRELQKPPGDAVASPMRPIANGVKIQVEFNPAQVQAYRLLGYENRMLRQEDFIGDRIDAGEVAAGHTVTALYEIVPVNAEIPGEIAAAGARKYHQPTGLAARQETDLLTLTVHYRAPNSEATKALAFPLRDTGHSFEQASADFKFAASVAAFGMILRESPHKGQATYAHVAEWAQGGLQDDAGGYRAEFVGLVGQAERLMQN